MLKFVIIMSTISAATAQIKCATPLQVGELRVFNSKRCVNIAGYVGRGEMNTYQCDGFDDQQIIICGDGTIRNAASPSYCFTPNKNGQGDVYSKPCEVYPTIPDYQKWRYGRRKSMTDTGGIRQEGKEIINVESGFCLNINGYDGTGGISMYRCEDEEDQFFYFRSRGNVIAHGRLQVQRSKLCLEMQSGSDGGRLNDNIRIASCQDSPNQHFTFYQNGELVNSKSRICVNIEGYDGTGDVQMYACDDHEDQMYSRPDQFCSGDFCAFRNQKSGRCLDFKGADATENSDLIISECDGAADQLFKWITESWVTPNADWFMVGCNQNGEVSQTVSNSVEYSSEISTEISIEISNTLEAGTEFAKGSVTTTISTSLANTWSETHSDSRDISYTCEFYDDNEPFRGGCMWQLSVTTRRAVDDETLSWKPQIVKCSSSNVAPTCPPFTKCSNAACTECMGYTGRNKKKSARHRLIKH